MNSVLRLRPAGSRGYPEPHPGRRRCERSPRLPSPAAATGKLAVVTAPAGSAPAPRLSLVLPFPPAGLPGARLRPRVGAGNAGDRPAAGTLPSMSFRPGRRRTTWAFHHKPIFVLCEIQVRVGRQRVQGRAQQQQSHGRFVDWVSPKPWSPRAPKRPRVENRNF